MLGERSDRAMEAMFGDERWQFQRIVSESDLQTEREILVLQIEADKYILPGLKRKDRSDLRDGKAINVCAYDDDTRDIYELKLQFEPPYYRLKDTIELFEKKRISAGQRIGFRYEAHFATLVSKLLR